MFSWTTSTMCSVTQIVLPLTATQKSKRGMMFYFISVTSSPAAYSFLWLRRKMWWWMVPSSLSSIKAVIRYVKMPLLVLEQCSQYPPWAMKDGKLWLVRIYNYAYFNNDHLERIIYLVKMAHSVHLEWFHCISALHLPALTGTIAFLFSILSSLYPSVSTHDLSFLLSFSLSSSLYLLLPPGLALQPSLWAQGCCIN